MPKAYVPMSVGENMSPVTFWASVWRSLGGAGGCLEATVGLLGFSVALVSDLRVLWVGPWESLREYLGFCEAVLD